MATALARASRRAFGSLAVAAALLARVVVGSRRAARRLPADHRRRRPRPGLEVALRSPTRWLARAHGRRSPRRSPRRGRDRAAARLADRPHRSAGRRLWATLGTLPLVDPQLHRRLPASSPRSGPTGCSQRRARRRAPALDLRLLRRLARADAVHLPAVLLPVRAPSCGSTPSSRTPRGRWAAAPLERLPHGRPAAALPGDRAGGLLVALYVMSDFGAVSIMRFDSFTREIYIAYTLDASTAPRRRPRRRARRPDARSCSGSSAAAAQRRGRPPARARAGAAAAAVPLGRWRWPALAFCAARRAVALVLPVGVLIYWSAQGDRRRSAAACELARRARRQLAAGRRSAPRSPAACARSSSPCSSTRYPGAADAR